MGMLLRRRREAEAPKEETIPDIETMKAAELRELADGLNIAYPAKATKAELKELIREEQNGIHNS